MCKPGPYESPSSASDMARPFHATRFKICMCTWAACLAGYSLLFVTWSLFRNQWCLLPLLLIGALCLLVSLYTPVPVYLRLLMIVIFPFWMALNLIAFAMLIILVYGFPTQH